MKYLCLIGALLAGLFLLLRPWPATLPDSALRVDITHRGTAPIELLEFRHGNLDTQESIIALNLRPGAQRSLVLNHQPGAGFNMITLSEGRKREVCIGKNETARHYALSFYGHGDFSLIAKAPDSALRRLIAFLRG
ncbi:hypothetical protein Q4485_06330 [Granulosicoccaceae sp. 1_MG-2023]|nr:hypothetical protein [Granulosicoccaceae sp. 1_MG-2023]